MSIAIQRIRRAIADMPAGGMQTGKQHIKLQYSDAQRAIAEIDGLTAERDALAAQVEVLRTQITKAREYLSHVDVNSAGVMLDVALESTPAACLAEVRADAAKEYYQMGWEHSVSTKAEDGDHYACGRRLAQQFSDAILQGGAS